MKLKEIVDNFGDVKILQIVVGKHLISIDLDEVGSWFVYRHFRDDKIDDYYYNEQFNHLICYIY